jgi:isochorismate synthase EntC
MNRTVLSRLETEVRSAAAAQTPCEITVEIAGSSFDPQKFFIGSSLFPKIYFKKRNSEEKIYAMGIKNYDPDTCGIKPACIFRGMPFPEAEMENEWSGFPGEINSYALILIKTAGDKAEITVCGYAEAESERKNNFNEALDALKKSCSYASDDFICDNRKLRADDLIFNPEFDGYKKSFDELKKFLNSSEEHKVVLARQVVAAASASQAEFMKRIISSGSRDYAYILAPDRSCCYAGLSPESLLIKKGSRIFTEAVAGTARKTDNFNELLACTKNDHENRIVSDWLSRHLSPFANRISVSDPVIIESGNLVHIKRSIAAELNRNTDDAEILRAVHPTPAMAGTPRSAALGFIGKYEKFSRGWYAGTLGIEEKNSSEYCVMIRGVLLRNEKFYFYTGSGLISSSESASEWTELNSKILSTADTIGIALPEDSVLQSAENPSTEGN